MTAIVNKTLLALLLIVVSIPTAHAQKSPKPKKPKRLSVKQQLAVERMRADSLAALVDEYRDREDRLANNRRAAQATNEKPIRNETTYIAYTPERADSLAELLHQFHKSIGSKCIMLRGDTKPLLFRLIIYVPGFQKSHLLYHLTCISQKLHTFRSQCNARPAAVKNSDPCFIFHIFDRPGKTWL